MNKTKSPYHGHRFPAVVISCAVRWYFRFSLSLRDIEELLLECGVVVTYETIRCRCDKPSITMYLFFYQTYTTEIASDHLSEEERQARPIALSGQTVVLMWSYPEWATDSSLQVVGSSTPPDPAVKKHRSMTVVAVT